MICEQQPTTAGYIAVSTSVTSASAARLPAKMSTRSGLRRFGAGGPPRRKSLPWTTNSSARCASTRSRALMSYPFAVTMHFALIAAGGAANLLFARDSYHPAR